MLYYVLYPLKDIFFGFNVVRYITFRSMAAAGTALLINILLGPVFIRFLYRLKIGEKVRKDECPPLYSLHRSKEGTPTMGGLIINTSIVLSVFLWADVVNPYVIITMAVACVLWLIGFYDDYLKLTGKSVTRGLSARVKIIIQAGLGFALAFFLLKNSDTMLYIPYIKDAAINLSWGFLLFVPLVFVGTANAVNLSDGLDGLAIGCVIITAFVYAILSYLTGHAYFARYLHIPYIPQAGELTIVCSALVGSGLGFLWYNCYPAQIFMGDSGSLVLGGIIGTIALIIKKELLLVLAGGIFVMEALSVIIQVGSFKLRGKRVFAMSPIHHHFEMKGWSETKITIRFWIMAVLCAIISLASLKLR